MQACKYLSRGLTHGACFFLVLLATVGSAEEIPRLSDIVSNVAKATVPTRRYSAMVHQSILRTNISASTSPTPALAQASEIEEADYAVSFETSGVLRVTKAIALKPLIHNANTNSPAATVTEHQRLMIIMNPIKALRHVETLSSTTITNDSYQNIPCYKVSATDAGFGFIMWISKTDSVVYRQIILQNSNTVFDSQFEYKQWAGYEVPARVVITKPSNGTSVIQEFSGHAF
jgi:hypothetical protein